MPSHCPDHRLWSAVPSYDRINPLRNCWEPLSIINSVVASSLLVYSRLSSAAVNNIQQQRCFQGVIGKQCELFGSLSGTGNTYLSVQCFKVYDQCVSIFEGEEGERRQMLTFLFQLVIGGNSCPPQFCALICMYIPFLHLLLKWSITVASLYIF